MKKFLPALICVWISLTGCSQLTSLESPDLVLFNGAFYTADPTQPWASAIVVEDGRLTYVGDNPGVAIGPETRAYDVKGATVIPGLIDAHSHPGFVALSTRILLLEEAHTREELLAALRKVVAENPDREVLIAGFWLNEIFGVDGPHKSELDAIESERPLIVYDDWGHTVWANSAALEAANVTRDTEDLVPGFAFYQKDDKGEPTGWITESAASVFINNFQTITPEIEQVLLDYLNYYREMGVTTVYDGGNFGLDRDFLEVIARLDGEGLLPVQYHGTYTLFVPDDLSHAVASLKQLDSDFGSDNIRIDTLKVFYDGVLETRTAAISEDYLDTPGNKGAILLSQEKMHDLIIELGSEGLNLHVHSVGDRATTTILNAVADAHSTLGRVPAMRVSLCHLEVTKDTDFQRFKDLGVIANFTPHWAVGGDFSWYEQGIGEEHLRMQRGMDLVNNGSIVTFSSDITDAFEWKTDRANPFLGMQVGHNRRDVGVGEDGSHMLPLSARFPLPVMVDGYTRNAAYQLDIEGDVGSLEVGKRADFIVLDRDLFSVDRDAIHKTKPVAVVVAGKVVAGSLSGFRKE